MGDLPLTPEALAAAKFRGPVAFYDYSKGGARQDFECIANPRFGYFWERKTRQDHGRQAYMVDGKEVADLTDACRLLALPPDPESPHEQRRRAHDEFRFSPKVDGATRALSEARCNGDAGPFATLRAWMKRADHGWHRGLNHFSDIQRTAGKEFPHWLYDVKSAAHETYRGIYLFEHDRKEDSNLRCALGKRCRDCPILQEIERGLIAARGGPFEHEIDDADIDAAKVWTCIGHALSEGGRLLDGAVFSTKDDHP